MLTSIGGAIISAITGGLLDKVEGAFKSYFEHKTTREQLQAEVHKALLATFAEVEKAYADSLAKTYATFMAAAQTNAAFRNVWVFLTISQSLVLIWHQVGIPFYTFATGIRYPSSGTTVEWAYALVAGLVGLGAYGLRGSNPNALADKLKSMIGK